MEIKMEKKYIGVLLLVVIGFFLLLEPTKITTLLNITDEEPLNEYHNDVVRYYVVEYSVKYNIPFGIIESVLYQETQFHKNNADYNAYREGDAGKSLGPGQVQVPTAKGVWKDSDIVITSKKLKYDIQFNVETAAKLIRHLYNKYKPFYANEKRLWLAVFTCYNTGEGSFEKNNRKFNNYAFEVYNRYIEIQKLKFD